ncbi:MAG TPA: VWA domain-containing protein [Candidatus Binataceae bacterium]|nr:VWA domain-containing protein [Candidatus Binataceae bacterium]
MNHKLIEFSNLMRDNGVRVSTAELLDTVAAASLTGLAERESFRAALRATMVKRPGDLPVFEQLFEIYFSGLGEIIKQAGDAVQDGMAMSDREFQEFLEQVRKFLEEQGGELSELARRLLEDNSGELERMIAEAARELQTSPIQGSAEENHFARALARALGLDRLPGEMRELSERAERQASGAIAARLDEYLEQRLRALDDIVRRYARLERDKREVRTREASRLNQIGDKSFYYLSEEELERMKQAVTRLAQRLKNVIAVRRKHTKRGRFDIKRTLRHNLQNGGVPFKLHFDRRPRDKPQVVVLCDISDSVRNASRFMLQFVYSLQDLYARVRSYVFVAEIGEVTPQFRDRDLKTALDLALSGDIINVYSHSNFGNAFRAFVHDHIGAINRRTTVIVLGDARNNYNLPHDWCLREIRQRAQRLIWLNPESRNTWGFGDSEMERYAAHCDMVEECRNLNQLYRVIDRLVPR